jgi:hypothetical protein
MSLSAQITYADDIDSTVLTGIVRLILGKPGGSKVPSCAAVEVWSIVHICMGIICASLPLLRPMVKRVRAIFSFKKEKEGGFACLPSSTAESIEKPEVALVVERQYVHTCRRDGVSSIYAGF